MLLSNLKSQVIRLVSGGILTDEGRYDFSDIEDKIHYGRAFVISQDFKETKRIASSWLQPYTAIYDKDMQDTTKFIRFKVPNVIQLDNYRDGFIYVGANNSTINWRRINNRAELANFNANRITKQRNGVVKYLYEDGFIEVYGDNEIRKIRIDGIFQIPTEIPSFNQDIDPYPLGEKLIGALKDYLLKTTLLPEQQKLPDIIADGRETPQAKLAQP